MIQTYLSMWMKLRAKSAVTHPVKGGNMELKNCTIEVDIIFDEEKAFQYLLENHKDLSLIAKNEDYYIYIRKHSKIAIRKDIIKLWLNSLTGKQIGRSLMTIIEMNTSIEIAKLLANGSTRMQHIKETMPKLRVEP